MTTINKKQELEKLIMEIKEIDTFIKDNHIKLSTLPTFDTFNYSHYYYYFKDKKHKPLEPLLENVIFRAKAFRDSLLKDLEHIRLNSDTFLKTFRSK